MQEKHICDLKHIELHGSNFGKEIEYYLNKYSMSQKELAQRLGISTQYVYIIINSPTNVNLSLAIIEGLENVFNLELGTLSEVYSIYSNKEKADTKNISSLLKNYGEEFLIKNPHLPLISNIKLSTEMPINKKLMMMNRFYGVADLRYYDDYLKNNAIADESVYKNPNSKVWIRFCELSIPNLINDKSLGIFRKTSFNLVLKKIIKIICQDSLNFKQKILEIKNFLLTKGMILITMPFIENSNIEGIAFQKGARRLIFVSDIYECEAFIFRSILHEVTHCFFVDSSEDEIDQIYTSTYESLKSNIKSRYSGLDDAIEVHENHNKIKHSELKGKICETTKKILAKYPKVSFK
ncbi:helix-turn-helix domain-containing protein [Mycoplasma enhydrae]|uniref:helix-turn-helix domain-containing protein n=1 Tax=Mycoplasma enhydrae TaxID=2499220 RepID=UPI00197C4F08|nr:helix-turn-helix transcriptional regulator [Mycoplasma enhydrae]MBN4089734.1 helix-turn-helix transcriptional regulator [Mycoplasma enhydrae]MCV3733948.1 helix-turn-helix domain-containing protein [Mycoplasma enhydrae]